MARYLGAYGSERASKAVFISSVPPFLLKTADNPDGVDASVFAGIEKAISTDRYAFFTEFFKNFFNTDVLLGKGVSEETVRSCLRDNPPSKQLDFLTTWISYKF